MFKRGSERNIMRFIYYNIIWGGKMLYYLCLYINIIWKEGVILYMFDINIITLL